MPTRNCLLGLTLLCWSGVAWPAAMEEDFKQLLNLSLDELLNLPVVTASRQSELRDHTASHIVVVTAEQIRERRWKNLADLLEAMPGVDFQRGTKSSQYNQFTVQGYTGPNKLVVMLDGVRIGHPAGGNFPLAENLALYPAKQVEFLYGPAAALYGADAVAGVINIVTDRAETHAGAWASVGTGRFDSREASFMGGVKTESGLALSVGGHWQQSDRAPLQDFYPGDFPKVDAKAGNTVVVPAAQREDYIGDIASYSVYARLDMDERWTLGYYRDKFRSLTSTGDPPRTALYLDDSRWITTTDTAYGKYRFTLSPKLDGELVVDFSRMEVDPQAKYNNSYNNFIDGYSYVLGERLGIEQNLNWRLDDRHRVQAGLGYQKHYAIETASLPAPYDTARGPDDQDYFYPNTPLPLAIHDAEFENVSAYAQLQSDWNASLSSTVGLRLDRHSDYGQTLNPRLGLVWRVNPRHVLKAAYGEAFRAPSPEEYLSSFGLFDGSVDAQGRYVGYGFRVPNFELEPEKARTLGLTWDWRPRPDLNLVAHLYKSRIENLISTLPSEDVEAIPGAILVNPETKGNVGYQEQVGLDLMLQWRFKIGAHWRGDLWANASWADGHLDEGNGIEWQIGHLAEYKAKLGATFRYRDRFTLSPQVLWTGDVTNGRKNSADPPNRLTTPGYTVANLHLGWHRLLDGKATLWLDIYNVFDERYDAAHGSGSRTFFDMPQQPRSWMTSLEYRF
ncbi:MAG: TonB-dependent receptor plug domain-containing protein [Pseudomonadota bacterium]